MEMKLQNGDYLSNEAGGMQRVRGKDALLQRVQLKLMARRGNFPFMEEFGSRLWQLGQLPAGDRANAAKQYVAEALEGEAELTVEEVVLSMGNDDTMQLTVNLSWNGEHLSLALEMR